METGIGLQLSPGLLLASERENKWTFPKFSFFLPTFTTFALILNVLFYYISWLSGSDYFWNVDLKPWRADIEPLIMTPTNIPSFSPLMWDAPVQPSSHVQTPERRLRCFLQMYCNTVTSVTYFFSRAPSQGRIYSPQSPEVFPVYTIPSHVEDLSGLIIAAAVVVGIPAGCALQHSQEPHIRFLKSLYATWCNLDTTTLCFTITNPKKWGSGDFFLIVVEDLWCFPKQKLWIRRSITIFMCHKPLWRVSMKTDTQSCFIVT